MTVEIKYLQFSPFIQLPPEISSEISRTMTIQELLKMRLICTHCRDFIDSEPSLQTKISYHSLAEMQSRCHIPLDDLKMHMTHGKLFLEVNGNLCLWKLTNQPELNLVISRISHFFIKEGKSEELLMLFTRLLQNNKLFVLYLFNCELDAAALEKLQSLLAPEDGNLKSPQLYLCNLHLFGCEWPSHLSHSDNVKMIEADKAGEYSIEKILSKDSDLEDIAELERQVQDEQMPAETIIKKLKELNPAIQAGIVSSIWYSKLIPSSPIATPPLSRNVVKCEVFDFVGKNPHHSSLRIAISKCWKLFKKDSNGYTSF